MILMIIYFYRKNNMKNYGLVKWKISFKFDLYVFIDLFTRHNNLII